MFKRVLSWWFASVLFAAVVPAAAQTERAAAEALMRQSGLWQQLGVIGPQVRAGFLEAVSSGAGKPTADELQRMLRAIDGAYAPHRLRSVVLDVLARNLDPQHVGALQSWYDSARGADITRMELSTADDLPLADSIRAGNEALTALPPDRRALLVDLVTSSRSAEAMTTLTINTALAIQHGIASARPDAPGLSPREVRLSLEARRPQLLQGFAALSLGASARTYAALADGELSAYLDFLKSPPAQHFTDVMVRALDAALVEAGAAFGRGLPGTRDGANI